MRMVYTTFTSWRYSETASAAGGDFMLVSFFMLTNEKRPDFMEQFSKYGACYPDHIDPETHDVRGTR